MRRSSTRDSDTGAPRSGPRDPGRLVAGVVMLALIAAGVMASALDRRLFAGPGGARLLDGTWAAAWQAAYEKALPVRDSAGALWTLLKMRLFGETRPEVLIGSDGWLYSSEEFDAPRDLSVPLGDAIRRVAAIRDVLAVRGIDLVVALVPTKAGVQSAHLGRYAVPPDLARRYDDALDALRSRGVSAPDLLAALRDGAAVDDMYLRTDTHWTPDGARRAAEALAPSIEPLLDAHGSQREPFVSTVQPPHAFAGDLLKFLPLGPWQDRGPPEDIVQERVTETLDQGPDEDAGDELFGNLDIPVSLVGTSYSANPISGFEGALRDALDADVLNVAKEGKGPFTPMEAYLGSPAIDDPRPDVVVWEIPERYLIPDQP